MARTRRWLVSTRRKVVATVLGIIAVFLVCASAGAGSWVAAALGVAIGAAGLAFYVVSALNSREFVYVPGTANVQSCSPPPAASQYGRCELLLIVHAPGMDDVAVKTREPRVPVAKWPHQGSTLPILVAVTDRRRLKVLWDHVRTHGDAADVEYSDEDIVPTADLTDLFGDSGVGGGPAGEGDPEGDFVELEVIDPTMFQPGPGLGRWHPTDDEVTDAPLGDQESAGIDEAPGARESIEVELSSMVQEAGAGAPGASADEGRQPSPHQRPSPRPRPRRPIHDELDDGLINPDIPPRPGVGPTEGMDLPTAQTDSNAGGLQVDQVVSVDPAVPVIPEQPTADDPGIADAYLTATPPPGSAGRRSTRGMAATLLVTNLTRAVAFYRDTLGFQQIDEGLGSAVLESGDSRIVLRRVADLAPVDHRLVHLLLEVPDVRAAYEDLRARGVAFAHRPRPVSRYEQLELWSAAFRDPDGHGIALIRWDPSQPSTERRTEST